ncbi:MAG: hypothetical protein MK202_09845 [Tenacibaculum sp.]|nr:hypothetical protein [Tenacibaculum sp.]
MNKEKITYITEQILMKNFLLNFVPGLPLYFEFSSLIDFSSFEGIASLIILITISWTLGLCFEILLFDNYYKTKVQLSNENSHYLLIAKFSLAICFAFIIELILFMIDSVDNSLVNEKAITRILLKKGMIVVLAALSWYHFKSKLNSEAK